MTAVTDNAMVYRHGGDWGWVCAAWQLKRRFTKPGCAWTNGKACGDSQAVQRLPGLTLAKV
jgi:hypothetical protein